MSCNELTKFIEKYKDKPLVKDIIYAMNIELNIKYFHFTSNENLKSIVKQQKIDFKEPKNKDCDNNDMFYNGSTMRICLTKEDKSNEHFNAYGQKNRIYLSLKFNVNPNNWSYVIAFNIIYVKNEKERENNKLKMTEYLNEYLQDKNCVDYKFIETLINYLYKIEKINGFEKELRLMIRNRVKYPTNNQKNDTFTKNYGIKSVGNNFKAEIFDENSLTPKDEWIKNKRDRINNYFKVVRKLINNN